MADPDLPLKAAIVQVTPFQQNCTILWCTKTMQAAIIDPGGDVPSILAGIEKTGVKPQKILLTHGHIDHAGGAAELAETLKLEIEGPHKADEFLMSGLEAQAREYGLQDIRNTSTGRWLEEGETVEIGSLTFDVLHCPGHTPGHVVLVNKPAGFGVFGDVLFQGSIGRTDFPYGDHDALIDAIVTKLLPLGDEIFFLCGHGPASTIGHERQHNPFLQGNR